MKNSTIVSNAIVSSALQNLVMGIAIEQLQQKEQTHTNNPIIDKEINFFLDIVREKTASTDIKTVEVHVIHNMFGNPTIVGIQVKFKAVSFNSDGFETIEGEMKSLVNLI